MDRGKRILTCLYIKRHKMKTQKILLVGLTILSLSFTACTDDGFCVKGNGDIESMDLNLEEFNSIELMESADVVITQGTNQHVTVTGDANIIDLLETDVRNGEWSIELENGCYRNYQLDVEITVPDLSQVSLSGSGHIYVNAFDNQNNLDLSISGSGKIELERFRDTRNLDVRISGSGDVIGYDKFDQLQNLDVRISGSGNYDAYPIEVKNADINITGSGDCYTSVSEILNVNISGSGRIRYHGSPTVKKNITGSGSVRKTD